MKPVPFFPLYAANVLASKPFKMMTTEERGLWITIQMECWVNGSVPSDLKDLAKYLGVGHDEVQRSFSQKQFSFLQNVGNELKSPELEEQRKKYMDGREQQRLGGIEGAKRKAEKERQRQAKEAFGRQGQPQGMPAGDPKGSLIQFNSNSINSNQLIRSEVSDAENRAWVEAYVNAPDAAEDYLRASKGR
ncbi:hypothetical protein G6715_03700 [Polynucleobacter paneuropaeus]|nr:hypothetical protein [Polynucleobacter paneuropaeus]